MKKINKGAMVAARRNKARAILKYQAHPQICRFCGGCILILGKQQPGIARRKKFCSHSCAAKSNNINRVLIRDRFDYGKCKKCHTVIEYTVSKKGKLSKQKYCDSCRIKRVSFTGLLTKKELYDRRKNWQSAKNAIRKHAYKIFYESGKKKECIVCGYSKHIEVAHIVSVSSFSDDTLISIVNHINNLIALCPNHHWEFDNGILTI